MLTTSTVDQPPIPSPPTFSDFKFSVIGQPPQLLKRMGTTPPFDFRPSPTPMYMDLQYPSRAGTPWTSVETSQPSLQQRLESTNYHTDSISGAHHLPMDVSEHLTERKPTICSEQPQPITSPFQSFDGPTSPLSKQTSLHSSSKSYGSQAPQPSSNTCVTIRRSPLPTIPSALASVPLSSISVSEIHHDQSSKATLLQVHLDIKLLYESALIAFEKAERGLESAQETYDAAKATLTAIATRFPQALASEAYPQHTSKTAEYESFTSSNFGDSADPVLTKVSRDIARPQTRPIIQKRPIRQLGYPTLTAEQRAVGHRITELEQEADDVRLAWRSLSAQRQSMASLTLEANDYPPSAIPSHMQSPLGTSTSSPPATQSVSANVVADSTIIVKDEDITDHRRPYVLGKETSLHNSSRQIDSTPSHISNDPEVGKRSPLAPVLDSSRLVEDAKPTRTTTFVSPTGTQDTTTIADSSGRQPQVTKPLALRSSLRNSIQSDDIAEDICSVDLDHTRGESNPISLGEDISNELEVVRELEREDSGPCSSSSQDPSRSSSVHPPNDTVDEEALQTQPFRPDSRENTDRNCSTVQGSTSELCRSVALPSSRVDHRSINGNSLLQRLQPSVSAAPSSKILELQSKSVTGPPSSSPSVLGKRQHFDPPSPQSQPSVVLPSKRRHFTNLERKDPPSLESRISEASAPANEPIRSNSPTSPTHCHTSYNKNSHVPTSNYIPPVERSISPPSGPRASRPESFHSKPAPSRPLSANYRSPVDRQLGVGSDCHPNKYKGKGLRKKYAQDGPIQTSGYDRSSGTGRGGMRQNRVTFSPNGSTVDNAGLRRSDVRTRPSLSERREQISLADRLRDP